MNPSNSSRAINSSVDAHSQLHSQSQPQPQSQSRSHPPLHSVLSKLKSKKSKKSVRFSESTLLRVKDNEATQNANANEFESESSEFLADDSDQQQFDADQFIVNDNEEMTYPAPAEQFETFYDEDDATANQPIQSSTSASTAAASSGDAWKSETRNLQNEIHQINNAFGKQKIQNFIQQNEEENDEEEEQDQDENGTEEEEQGDEEEEENELEFESETMESELMNANDELEEDEYELISNHSLARTSHSLAHFKPQSLSQSLSHSLSSHSLTSAASAASNFSRTAADSSLPADQNYYPAEEEENYEIHQTKSVRNKFEQPEEEEDAEEEPEPEEEEVAMPQARHDPPPLSSLVQKYWANANNANKKVKPIKKSITNTQKNQNREEIPQNKPAAATRQQQNRTSVAPSAVGSSISLSTSSAMESELTTLRAEISKYQKSSARLARLKREQEIELRTIREENSRARARLDEDVKSFEIYKSEELKRLRNLKLEADREKRKAAMEPERKERASMELLRKESEQQLAEARDREEKLKATVNSLRHQLNSVNSNFALLKHEKIRLEQERLEFAQLQEKVGKLQSQLNLARKSQADKDKETEIENNRKLDSERQRELMERENEIKEREISRKQISNQNQQQQISKPPQIKQMTPSQLQNNSINIPSMAPSNPLVRVHSHTLLSPSKSAAPQPSFLGPTPDSLSSRDLLAAELSSADEQIPILRSLPHPGGKVENFLSDGSRIILFRNGTRKRIHNSGQTRIVFPNGDLKLHYPASQTTVYYYSAADTVHTSFPDGLQIYEFSNQQKEKHYPDGTKQIFFPDGTNKIITQ